MVKFSPEKRRQIERDMIALESYIKDCNFEKTADAYAYTLIGIKTDLERKYIDTDEYHRYKDKAENILKENRCKCSSVEQTDKVIKELLSK